MGFKEVQDLNAETVFGLGAKDKSTGKTHPKEIEGFYLGKKQVENKKAKSGVSYIYIFQTDKGAVGIWGKTDMDRKMKGAILGQMTKVALTGTRETPNGPMYTYRVWQDEDNTVAVAASSDFESDYEASAYSSQAESDDEEDDETFNGTFEDRGHPTSDQVSAKAARRAKVSAMLNKTTKR